MSQRTMPQMWNVLRMYNFMLRETWRNWWNVDSASDQRILKEDNWLCEGKQAVTVPSDLSPKLSFLPAFKNYFTLKKKTPEKQQIAHLFLYNAECDKCFCGYVLALTALGLKVGKELWFVF